jgi:hypothetical protein
MLTFLRATNANIPKIAVYWTAPTGSFFTHVILSLVVTERTLTRDSLVQICSYLKRIKAALAQCPSLQASQNPILLKWSCPIYLGMRAPGDGMLMEKLNFMISMLIPVIIKLAGGNILIMATAAITEN